jgi:hypothetical protein
VEKIVECEKTFRKRQLNPLERLCGLLKKVRINHMILLEEKVVREGIERRISEEGGLYAQSS